ncbi:MAG: SDR family NAD(P)-dependent oxidoreductase [Nostoc sp. ChiSLP02]|nr:SDR family NAD(P)-dependent oxidoreductase [Nostoc sp. DedSLP05]MDZ8103945.1 SDR family NAD(P)-dependent oxidoreductase [Nostoc sp. DedSLP01]MDZ8187165.1 SDR family NAD(P)-dependent oxidoreductase [Nostoc sp. ChiSLP02]
MQIEISQPRIAVIGMGCWYPGARDLRQLWENILSRRRQFRESPVQRLPLADYYDPDPAVPDKTYGKRMAVIEGFDFDWASKRIPKTVVETADIAHWLALEVAIAALQDSGYTKANVPNERTGVILGNSLTGEQTRSNNMRLRWPFIERVIQTAAKAKGLPLQVVDELTTAMQEYYKSVFSPFTEDTLSGNLSNTIAGRICNFFNFHGGGYTVDGACSSSLIAVATAANALSNGDLDLALAGGVDISLDTFELVGFAKTGALTSKDMTVYDKKASGFIPGEGAGFVVLKRLEDARADNDYIYAVLNGWGISSDGKGGLTAPSREGQAKALRRAYNRAGYSLSQVDFIEGHGTGTPVGDRAELEGIALAMGADSETNFRSCGVTSFKSLVGHTKAAAGIGGFIKAVMAVNRRVIPPLAGCNEPSEVFDKAARSLYPVMQGEIRQPTDTLRAGVSAMGFGGINCHVTLESGDAPATQLEPSIDEEALLVSAQETEIFVLSAASIAGLLQRIDALLPKVQGLSLSELIDLASHLAQKVNQELPVRAAIIARSPDELVERLTFLQELLNAKPLAEGEVILNSQQGIWVGHKVQPSRIGFLFPGQGSQKLNMARTLVQRFSWAKELVNRADKWLQEIGVPGINESIYQPVDRAINGEQLEEWSGKIAQTEIAQPAICLTSLLWMRYLQHLGLNPVAVGGHSLGELTAFHAAGAFDEQALIRLAAVRGRAMSACKQGGSMVSIACSRVKAEELLKQVNGYVAIANINSPNQIIISGERSSIEQVIELAAAEEIRTHKLPVSHAFHSQLVSEAAQYLHKYELIPDRLSNTTLDLVSSVDGKQPPIGLQLREHFAHQVLAQVDFVSLVKTLEQICDVLIEVGPGKVLSGLVNDITGLQGLECLPVEAKPGFDQSLNTMLANVFVRGHNINWEALYEGRLVRPFVPASERIFIDNPVERPFAVSATHSSPSLGIGSESLLNYSLFAEHNHTSPEVLQDYLARRGKFIAEVIRADMQTLPLAATPQNGARITHAVNGNGSHSTVSTLLKPAETNTNQSVEFLLADLIVRQTGYVRESITAELRLLDDLNLDSIKAGEIVAEAAKQYGVAGKIDPPALANATIQEIAETIRSFISNGHEAASIIPTSLTKTTDAIASSLTDLIIQQTGYVRESITAELRLLDDLNLDSIKAGEVVAEAAKLFGAAGKIDPPSLANATIQEIAETIHNYIPNNNGNGNGIKISESSSTVSLKQDFRQNNGKITAIGPELTRKQLVRDYIVQNVPEEIPSVALGRQMEENWQAANVLILYELSNADKIAALSDQLRTQGAQVQSLTFAEASPQTLANSLNLTHFIAVLPSTPNAQLSSEARLIGMIERLRSIATPPLASRDHTTVAYVQFSGGYFGAKLPLPDIDQCCTVGFAASLHLERTDLKVRVIDFSPTVDPNNLAECVFRELSTPHVYTTVSYDTDLRRYVPRPQVQQPVDYLDRNITWSSEDVILVTGGAKGITAECALALAKDTGVRVVLVGRSLHQDDNSNSDITRTLLRFQSEGLTCRYYACDVADYQAVVNLLQKVRQELGEISGVIHGAALNKPRLIEQVSTEAAFDEISPKLLGLINLCKALEGTSLKLFAGFSSVIGFTGMQRNAWYGFSNETLDLILRRFQVQHPETAVVSMAYSVWEEVGMGARMGSVRSLNKMGISAIPKDAGVSRFLHLIKNEAADLRVVIAAPMQTLAAFESSGFDTWYPGLFSPPAKSKFLEKILIYQPGVEVVLRAHLSLERDSYLHDHLYKGSYLFPTVFGLEAMAQAVAYVTSQDSLPAVQIEDIRLERPIVVAPDKGVDIEIHAEVLERKLKSDPQQVYVTIKTEQTGFAISHFSATFLLDVDKQPPLEQVEVPEVPLDIEPQADLYSWLLFQGTKFQRLQQVYSLNSQKCVFKTQRNLYSAEEQKQSLDRAQGPFLLGDPYCRDSLLQAGQLVIPQDLCLPIRIDSIEIYQSDKDEAGSYIGVTTPQGREGQQYRSNVFLVAPDGRVIERLNSYQLRILEHRQENPTAEDLADPSQRDELILARELSNRSPLFKVVAPEISLGYLPGIHTLLPTERHQLELPLFHRAIAQLLNNNANLISKVRIQWTESGKPVVVGLAEEKIEVSLAHDERVCFCVAGRGVQGCDIEPITHRSTEDWIALLNSSRYPLIQQLETKESVDSAGTRIWTAIEALRKATKVKDINLAIERIEGDSILFSDATANSQLKVLTFPIKLTRSPERMIALVVIPFRSLNWIAGSI